MTCLYLVGGQLEADDDRVAVMVAENVCDRDQLDLSAALPRRAVHEVRFR